MKGLDIAKTMLGLHEVRDNKKLKDFLKTAGSSNAIDPAQTAWCAAFVNACERAAGNTGTMQLNARSYLKYGKSVTLMQAQPGDIVIFQRGGSTWQGHVAYYNGIEDSENGRLIRTIGGNQSDSVSKGWYPEARLLGIRRP
jgi:uncharacterized protein (TIGR02594 family)